MTSVTWVNMSTTSRVIMKRDHNIQNTLANAWYRDIATFVVVSRGDHTIVTKFPTIVPPLAARVLNEYLGGRTGLVFSNGRLVVKRTGEVIPYVTQRHIDEAVRDGWVTPDGTSLTRRGEIACMDGWETCTVQVPPTERDEVERICKLI